MIDEQLNQAIELARAAAARGDFATAVVTQERVVGHVRLKAQGAEELITLSVQMYNLADYYTGWERFDEAVRLLEEVVGFDERLGLPDVESDREMLAQVRKLAGMTPGQRDQFYADTPAAAPSVSGGPDAMTQLLDQLEGIESIDRADLEALMRELAALSPEEQLQRVMALRGKRDD